MTVGPVEHLSVVRVVPGFMWIGNKRLQELEKQNTRRDLDGYVDREGYDLVSEVRETLIPDEKNKAMIIEYRAEGVRR